MRQIGVNMNKLKKLLALILMGALVLCLALSVTSCGGGGSEGGEGGEGGSGEGGAGESGGSTESCNHFDLGGDGKCDACGEDFEEELIEFELTVIAKDGEGNALNSVTVHILDNGYEMDSATTDAEGKATFTLPVGSYMVHLTDLPEFWSSDMKSIEGNEKTVSVVITAQDNTPDGSAEKPFFVGDEEMELMIPESESFTFIFKGMNRILKVQGAGFEVTAEGEKYTDITDGMMQVDIVGTDDPYSNTSFIISNVTDVPITVTLRLESQPGTMSNPLEATLDTEYSADIARESILYYTFTAAADGVLTAHTDNEKSNIVLTNLNSYADSGSSDGASSISIAVKAGETVSIKVSHTDSAESYNVAFTLTLDVSEAE